MTRQMCKKKNAPRVPMSKYFYKNIKECPEEDRTEYLHHLYRKILRSGKARDVKEWFEVVEKYGH